MRETPSVLYALASALGTRAVALEWSHEEMEAPLQEFLCSGSFDFDRLWSFPASAEFFCGDGRAFLPDTSRCSGGSAARAISIR